MKKVDEKVSWARSCKARMSTTEKYKEEESAVSEVCAEFSALWRKPPKVLRKKCPGCENGRRYCRRKRLKLTQIVTRDTVKEAKEKQTAVNVGR